MTQISLFGAPLDTGNLGVSALGTATLAGIHERSPEAQVTVFDNGSGVRRAQLDIGPTTMDVELRGAWNSRRIHRPESLWNMYASSALSGVRNPNVAAIDRSSLVLDASGGDSFCDLYGQKRFRMVTLPKRIALRRKRPLVLLPQTYGPFRRSDTREIARRIVMSSAAAWARDEDSYAGLRELLGAEFDPSRHRLGVDVAFLLPTVEPTVTLGVAGDWLLDDEPVIGVNVSGLLYNHPQDARSQFGLASEYRATLRRLVAELLRRSDHRILLVPHVVGDTPESDVAACEDLEQHLDAAGRVATVRGLDDATTVKWVISRLDWFTGARMHATIAALSSRTPVAGIAYSDKIRGVFATCGVADQVVDARSAETQDLVDQVVESFERRDQTRARLVEHIPGTLAGAARQFDEIMAQHASGTSQGQR